VAVKKQIVLPEEGYENRWTSTVIPRKTKMTFAKGVANLAAHFLTIVKVPLK
jgi:hypothetical protein